MSQYLILIYADEAQWANATPGETAQLTKEHAEFGQRHADVIRDLNRRMRAGRHVLAGPRRRIWPQRW